MKKSEQIWGNFEVLVSFYAGGPSGRAPPWSGRAHLEWSRQCKFAQENAGGVVAHHPGGRAHLWSGRAPSQTLFLLDFAQIRPPLASNTKFLTFKCTIRVF